MTTYPEAAVEILKQAQKPLHYKEIARRAQEQKLIGDARTPSASMSSCIVTNMKRYGNKSAFKKVGKGIYTLNPEFPTKGNFKDMSRVKDRATNWNVSERFTKSVKEITMSTVAVNAGEYTHGEVNKLTKFVFCEKQRALFNAAFEKYLNYDKNKKPKPLPALYVLFDIRSSEVYVGETDVGKGRIGTHWSSGKNFTHVAVIFDVRLDDDKIRKKLEWDLLELCNKKKSWKMTTKRAREVSVKPNDEHVYYALQEAVKRIVSELWRLIDEFPKLPDVERKPVSPKTWIWPTPLAAHNVMRANLVWASKAPLEKIKNKIKPGDRVVFYVSEHKALSGMYEFVGGWYETTKPLWADELKTNTVIHSSQIRLRRIKDGIVAISSLSNLEIFKNRANKGLALRTSSGYPANNIKPLPSSDVDTIIRNLRPGTL